ncbi:uncharacterized, partial [Tachysurus ichikawai]
MMMMMEHRRKFKCKTSIVTPETEVILQQHETVLYIRHLACQSHVSNQRSHESNQSRIQSEESCPISHESNQSHVSSHKSD